MLIKTISPHLSSFLACSAQNTREIIPGVGQMLGIKLLELVSISSWDIS